MKLDLTEQSLPVYEALSSTVRLHMLRLLSEKPMNVKELAAALKLSSAIMTMHVRKLEAAGLIRSHMAPGKSGLQKICTLAADGAEIVFPGQARTPRRGTARTFRWGIIPTSRLSLPVDCLRRRGSSDTLTIPVISGTRSG